MSLVVDASVALKWVLDEEGAFAARGLIGAEPLLAPDFIWLECANVLAMKARTTALTDSAAAAALSVLQSAPIQIFPAASYVAAAQALAMELRQSAYDCLYLALALAEGAQLVTADRRFAQAVLASSAYFAALRPI